MKNLTWTSAAGNYTGDLHAFEPAAAAWADLTSAALGDAPAPRAHHGFASAGGRLYVQGGQAANASGA